jgi:hypothetical protein
VLTFTRGLDHSGGSVRNLNIEPGAETEGGVAILVEALPDSDGSVNSLNRHSFLIDNVQVGRNKAGSGSFEYGLLFDGSQNPDGNPNSVPGLRGVYVWSSSFGATTGANVYLNLVRGAYLNVEC